MSKLYSVYATPQISSQDDSPTRAIAQGFSWYAFILTPIWALHRAGWLTMFVWLIAVIALIALNQVLPFDQFLPYMLLALMFGFTAREFEARNLERHGFHHVGELLADSAIEAEVLAASSVETQRISGQDNQNL